MPSILPPLTTSRAPNGYSPSSSGSTCSAAAPLRRLTKLTNAYLVLPNGELSSAPSSLWVDEGAGRIVRVEMGDGDGAAGEGEGEGEESEEESATTTTTTIDLHGQILAPGLIDVQINGAFGVDFSAYEGDAQVYTAGLDKVARGLVQTGVTGFVPTIISQTPETYPTLLPLLDPTRRRRAKDAIPADKLGAHALGYHLEGPFLSPHKPGCHPQPNLTSAPAGWSDFERVYGTEALGASSGDASDELEDLDEEECVKVITLAPELAGVGRAIPELARRGWVVSVGHSAATTEEAVQAVASGARMITHLFNAMPSLHHREPGIVGLLGLPPVLPPSSLKSSYNLSRTVHSAMPSPPLRATRLATLKSAGASQSGTPRRRISPGALEREMNGHAQAVEEALGAVQDPPMQFGDGHDGQEVVRPWWGIIADGIHCHPQAVNFAYKAHPEGCVLVTDAVQMMDPTLADGVYPWREGSSILKQGSSITLSGTSTLAGSAVTLDECVRNLAIYAAIPLSQAILCASTHAARSLGGRTARRKGQLVVGMDADMSVWDRETGRVLQTWIGGRQAWEAKA